MSLKLEGIEYSHQQDTILHDINLEIKSGECVSVVGGSGSGKSTLLRLCADLIMPTKGQISYNGRLYTDYDPTELRQTIGYCVQLPYLFGETVRDNLIFPFQIRHEQVDDQRIKELLQVFRLDESYLEKNVHNLSGGEKQRLSLIRSLIYTPKVLLLDEVTASLDEENGMLVEAYISKLNEEGTTVIWITHNEAQSRRIFSRRITIQEGRIFNEEILKVEREMYGDNVINYGIGPSDGADLYIV